MIGVFEKMKKLIYSIAFFLTLSTVGNTAFASEDIKPSEEMLTEIGDIANNSKSVELIDVDELPNGTPFIYFDTVEDFENAIKELDEENKNIQVEINKENSLLNQSISTMAATKSTTDRLKVLLDKSINPLKNATQPVNVTVDLKYSYTGSGSTKQFSTITDIKSFSLGVPTDWVQTDYNKSYYNSKKSVKIELLGYNVLGVVIKGQPIGAKISDEIIFSYTLGGTKDLFEDGFF